MKDLQFAIQMELDGMEYYKQQAEKNKDNDLHTVFWTLMKDEEYHAKLIKDVFNDTVYELAQTRNQCQQAENVFKNLGDFKDEIMAVPHQIDVYRGSLKTRKRKCRLIYGNVRCSFRRQRKNIV